MHIVHICNMHVSIEDTIFLILWMNKIVIVDFDGSYKYKFHMNCNIIVFVKFISQSEFH